MARVGIDQDRNAIVMQRTPMASAPRVVADHDARLEARVLRSWSLRYAEGEDSRVDRPGHVRAGSGLAWIGGRLAVVQDDANFVALIDPNDGHATAIVLPAGVGGRRQFDDRLANKAHKLDLEAVFTVPEANGSPLLVALGSGSSPVRESIVTVRGLDRPDDAVVAVHTASALYAELRGATEFAGSELNVEGAVFLDANVRLFNRGNGADRAGIGPVDAAGDLNWAALSAYLDDPTRVAPPRLSNIVQFDLGSLDGVRLTFTDGTPGPSDAGRRDRRILYSAAAEASPDATRDGPVTGSAIGVILESALGITARWTRLLDMRGATLVAKVEGLALHQTDPSRAFVVIDHDAHDTPSELCEVALAGPWFRDG